MGNIFTQTYTNLTMWLFKRMFYDLYRNKIGADLTNFIFENRRRFLDDFQTLLEKNKISPYDFLNVLNSINSPIQFKI